MRLNLFLFVWLMSGSSMLSAQNFHVNSISVLPSDKDLVSAPLFDINGNPCALLKVYVNDVRGIEFGGSMVYSNLTSYHNDYYAVYLANDAKTIRILHSDFLPLEVNFKEHNIKIKGGVTYKLTVFADGKKDTKTVLFKLSQPIGTIILNGKTHKVEDGLLQMELKPGGYTYSAHAENFHATEGKFNVADIFGTQIIPVKMRAETVRIVFRCNVQDAVVYIDNQEAGTVGILDIPKGNHNVRIVSDGYLDWAEDINMNGDMTVKAKMKAKKNKSLPLVVVADGYLNPTLYLDNQEVPSWVSGKAIQVKSGKHIVIIRYDEDTNLQKKKYSSERMVEVKPNMEPIVFYNYATSPTTTNNGTVRDANNRNGTNRNANIYYRPSGTGNRTIYRIPTNTRINNNSIHRRNSSGLSSRRTVFRRK